MDDRKRMVGGKLEVKIRVRNPIVTKQLEKVSEKWLVIDGFWKRCMCACVSKVPCLPLPPLSPSPSVAAAAVIKTAYLFYRHTHILYIRWVVNTVVHCDFLTTVRFTFFSFLLSVGSYFSCRIFIFCAAKARKCADLLDNVCIWEKHNNLCENVYKIKKNTQYEPPISL